MEPENPAALTAHGNGMEGVQQTFLPRVINPEAVKAAD
jgi:hypothetical protein